MIRSHFTDANGIRVHYLRGGSGPTLILLHGWPEWSHVWRPVMSRLVGEDQRRGCSVGQMHIDLIAADLPQNVEQVAVVEADLELRRGIVGGDFLGGGAILQSRDHDAVTGLTTAATIWIVSALGIACGGGHWIAVTTALVLVEFILILGRRVDVLLHKSRTPERSDAQHATE